MKRRANEDEDSGSEAGGLVSKKSKSGPTETSMPGSFEDDEGNTYWQVQRSPNPHLWAPGIVWRHLLLTLTCC